MPPRSKANSANQTIQLGSKVKLDVREPLNLFKFSPGREFSHIEDIIPIAKEVVPVKFRGKPANVDSGYELISWTCDEGSVNTGNLTVKNSVGLEKQVRAYRKVIPLMDPYRWMRSGHRPSLPFFWFSQVGDVNSHTNQGYVDVVASALVSKIGRENKIPHFCEFYGSCRAVMDTFLYNLEDDLEDVRFTKWFWQGLDSNAFGLRMMDKRSGKCLSLDEIKELMKPDDEFLNDDDSDDEDDEDSEEDKQDGGESSSDSDNESLGAESLPSLSKEPQTPFVCELEEAELETDEDEPAIAVNYKTKSKNHTPTSVKSMSTASSDKSYTDDFTVHAELYGMPVAIMYLELMDGTMDELLEDSSNAPVSSSEQEVRWGAWLLQVCAAMSQIQYCLTMTHNDLHTNNVLWKKTDVEFLVYKDTKGRVWRVPTFGKLFTVIDYGRAIFLLNGYHYISSDYDEGHDADGMYNFGRIEDLDLPKINPNKSFDLCRLACSLLRGLFPLTPESRPKAPLLTKEGSWEVHETNHPLFNLVWSWLRADNGSNILETESGEEKYPGFELYAVIAATVHGAIPDEQFKKKMCEVFLYKGTQPPTEKPILLHL